MGRSSWIVLKSKMPVCTIRRGGGIGKVKGGERKRREQRRGEVQERGRMTKKWNEREGKRGKR